MGNGGTEYLAWVGEQPEGDYTILMGANTYRLMSDFAADGEGNSRPGEAQDGLLLDLDGAPVVVQQPAGAQEAVESVRKMKQDGPTRAHAGKPQTVPIPPPSWTRGSLSGRGLPSDHGLQPQRRIYDGYPDVVLDMVQADASTAGFSCSSMSPRVPGSTTSSQRRERRHGGPMIRNALASVAVKNLDQAADWYGRVLGTVGHRPMAEVVEWQFEGGGGLQGLMSYRSAPACARELCCSVAHRSLAGGVNRFRRDGHSAKRSGCLQQGQFRQSHDSAPIPLAPAMETRIETEL